MEPWLVGMKLLLLCYVAVSFTLAGGEKIVPAVLLALAFTSAGVLSHLVKRRGVKVLFQALSTAAAAAGFFFVHQVFAALIPLAAAELVWGLSGSLALALLPGIAAAGLTEVWFLPTYLLAAGLSLGGFSVLARWAARLEAASREIEKLHAANDALVSAAGRSAEAEDERAYLTQLEERNRMAQEIHDKVGHTIAGGMIQIEAASALLERDREGARAMMENSVAALREGMESIRGTLRGIKPAREELGIHRLKAMLDEFSASGAVSTRLSFSGELSVISRLQWKTILDNIRECLTNTARHSAARQARVSLEVMNRLVKVEARDDGRGCYTITRGLGLAGMEERTEALGGKLVVDGSRGFSVIMLLPREEREGT